MRLRAAVGALTAVAGLAGTGCDEPSPRSFRDARPALAAPAARAASAATSSGAAEARAPAVVYVDVRSPEEFAAGHVEGAINIPHHEMAERWAELAPHAGDRLVLYCRSGRRSGIAERVLRDRGFENLENGGALQRLERAGVPVRRGGS